MRTVRIRLDTSDFTVERAADGRIHVYVSGEQNDVELDLASVVADDLFLALANPEDPLNP